MNFILNFDDIFNINLYFNRLYNYIKYHYILINYNIIILYNYIQIFIKYYFIFFN